MKYDLCADKKCTLRGTCTRFVVAPEQVIEFSQHVKIHSTLRDRGSIACTKYSVVPKDFTGMQL